MVGWRMDTQSLVLENRLSGKRKAAAWLSWGALILVGAGFLAAMVWLNLNNRGEQQFALLADSFLHGRLSFAEAPGGSWGDTALAHGEHYWPLGPLPAVVLMPFEVFAKDGTFYQGYLQPVLVIGVLAVVFWMARRIGYKKEDAAYLAFGFAFSTTFLGVALWPWSWYFSQVLCCLLVFGAIVEMLGRRRAWVVGILFALVLATRVTAALGLLWCVGEIVCERGRTVRGKMGALTVMGLPCTVVLAGLLWYNHARFGSAFEQGYAAQMIPTHAMAERGVGIFSARHLPGNLYWMLLAGPTPVRADQVSLLLKWPYFVANPWGMSLFLTSPCFVLLFSLRYRDTTSRLLWLAVVVIALPILFYYGVGYRQFGYRYALDFMPLLYCLLLRGYWERRGELSGAYKVGILLAAVWNLDLFLGHFYWGIT